MYADRYARPEGIKPGSLAVAIAINAAVVAALALSNPQLVDLVPDDPLVTRNIPLTPPPPPVPQPTPEAKARAERRTVAPPEQPDRSTATNPTTTTGYPPLPPMPPQPDPRPTTSIGGDAVTPLPPVLVEPSADPRFARDLQPDYPAAERRLEREGLVRLRVLVGIDGRVQQVERIDATSDAFFRATERQALSKWRFRPATRDGVPFESWKVMTVRFRLDR